MGVKGLKFNGSRDVIGHVTIRPAVRGLL